MKDEISKACGTHGRGVYGVLAGWPEGKRPPGNPRRRSEDKTKIYLRETGIDGANRTRPTQDSFVLDSVLASFFKNKLK
jgi:hypothetical protein